MAPMVRVGLCALGGAAPAVEAPARPNVGIIRPPSAPAIRPPRLGDLRDQSVYVCSDASLQKKDAPAKLAGGSKDDILGEIGGAEFDLDEIQRNRIMVQEFA